MSARKRQDHHRTHVTAPTPNANALIPLVFLIMVVPLKKLPPSPVFVWYVPSVCFNAKPWRRVSDWAPKFIGSAHAQQLYVSRHSTWRVMNEITEWVCWRQTSHAYLAHQVLSMSET